MQSMFKNLFFVPDKLFLKVLDEYLKNFHQHYNQNQGTNESVCPSNCYDATGILISLSVSDAVISYVLFVPPIHTTLTVKKLVPYICLSSA